MKHEDIACVCHEANRAYCLSLGDDSQLPWEDAPVWQTRSAVKGVENALSGEVTPEESHQSWLAEKMDAGWVYGEEKDEEKKTHPCICPYYDLSAEQQMKDHLFVAVAKTLGGVA